MLKKTEEELLKEMIKNFKIQILTKENTDYYPDTLKEDTIIIKGESIISGQNKTAQIVVDIGEPVKYSNSDIAYAFENFISLMVREFTHAAKMEANKL